MLTPRFADLMKRPFLVASDLRPCMPVDET